MVANHKAIKVVSPYIGLNYLQRIVKMSAGWSLISDVEAWLSSLTVSERGRTWAFIQENLGCIRHHPALHAKVVIGPDSAYLGSANLTSAGILSRTEMGILVKEQPLVQELHRWFDALWSQAHSPQLAEAESFVRWLDQQAASHESERYAAPLTASAERVRAKLASLSDQWGAAQEQALPIYSPDPEGAGPLTTSQQSTTALLDVAPVAPPKDVQLPDTQAPSLHDIIAAQIDTLASQRFSLRWLTAHLNEFDILVRRQDVYLALLPYCAALPRSVFSLGTVNRLLFVDGHFVQSSPLKLHQHLQPYDLYASHLILALSFDDCRPLPDPEALNKLSGLTKLQQTHLNRSLIDSEFLLALEDGYLLNESWEWSARFRLFTKSFEAWNQALSLQHVPQFVPEPVILPPPLRQNLSESASATAPSISTQQTPAIPSTRVNLPGVNYSLAWHTLAQLGQDRPKLVRLLDSVYLELARLIQASKGLETLKGINQLVYSVAKSSNQEDWFVAFVVEAKIPGVSAQFDIQFNRKKTRSQATRTKAAIAEINRFVLAQKVYPLTAAYISTCVAAREGYFYQVLGAESSVSSADPHPVAPAIKPANAPALERRANSKTLARAVTMDAIYSALLRLVEKSGNPLPMSQKADLLASMSRESGIALNEVEKLFGVHFNGLPAPLWVERASGSDGRLIVKRSFITDDELTRLPLTQALINKLVSNEEIDPPHRAASVPVRAAAPTTPPAPPTGATSPLRDRADQVYLNLAQRMALFPSKRHINKSIDGLVRYLASCNNESEAFVEKVLQGKVDQLPKLFDCWLTPDRARICEFQLNHAALQSYPKARQFIYKNLLKAHIRSAFEPLPPGSKPSKARKKANKNSLAQMAIPPRFVKAEPPLLAVSAIESMERYMQQVAAKFKGGGR